MQERVARNNVKVYSLEIFTPVLQTWKILISSWKSGISLELTPNSTSFEIHVWPERRVLHYQSVWKQTTAEGGGWVVSWVWAGNPDSWVISSAVLLIYTVPWSKSPPPLYPRSRGAEHLQLLLTSPKTPALCAYFIHLSLLSYITGVWWIY